MEIGHSGAGAVSWPNTLFSNGRNKNRTKKMARIAAIARNARLGLCGVCELSSSNLILPAPRSSCDPLPLNTLVDQIVILLVFSCTEWGILQRPQKEKARAANYAARAFKCKLEGKFQSGLAYTCLVVRATEAVVAAVDFSSASVTAAQGSRA